MKAKIVKLTPPPITPNTISEKIVCTRPMREGAFNISLENQAGKAIIHCYGQGGSGWTTLFGSVQKALLLFLSKKPSKNSPIRIIGSGCMGLTLAIELSRLGYKIAGITTKSLFDIPSWQAAGYMAMVSIMPSSHERVALQKIGIDSFLAFQQIFRGAHPYITKEALRLLPVYSSEDTETGVEDLEQQGLIPPREVVTLDFGNGVKHPHYVKNVTYFINTSALMVQLSAYVKGLGIPIYVQHVQAFGEIPEEIIFNCSGMGARELNDDRQLVPVRGHLVTLKADAGHAHMDYMIYTKVMQEDKEEYIYLFPKTSSVSATRITPCAGVLGGTFIPHVDKLPLAEQHSLDQIEFKRLLDRNAFFFHGKS